MDKIPNQLKNSEHSLINNLKQNNSTELNGHRPKHVEQLLVNCRSVTDFEKIEEIGEGTYGRVCKYS